MGMTSTPIFRSSACSRRPTIHRRICREPTRQARAVEQTDWHDLAERKFAGEVAETVNAACFNGGLKAIVVAAPPRTLSELRSRFSEAVKERILAEVNKDLTKHPTYEIERYLTAGA